jgi:hypothetical protein
MPDTGATRSGNGGLPVCDACAGTKTVNEPSTFGITAWPCDTCAPEARLAHALDILGAGETL